VLKLLSLVALLLLLATAVFAADRVQFKLDTSEADAVLSILNKNAGGQAVGNSDWQKLFTSEPYLRLKKREASMHRDFSDDDFRQFVLSEALAKKRVALEQTLAKWKKADLAAIGGRILPYLPADAHVKASIYPVIKPKSNSFVFEADTNPAIFLYLDPEQSQSEFENIVAHESHHIGFSDANKQYEERIKSLPDNAHKAAEWMGAFGEGLAVLAAAGSADVHPMKDFNNDQRIRWDQDMKFVDQELIQVNQFFLDVINGGYTKPEVADHEAFTFFGYRGPWYTVGYLMGKTVELRYGRTVLIECMSDPRMLLAKYNQAAAEQNAKGQDKLSLWSEEVLKAVNAPMKQG
jgi:predicted metal-dependent hydrolase